MVQTFKRKIVAVGLAAVLMAGTLAGCGSTSQSEVGQESMHSGVNDQTSADQPRDPKADPGVAKQLAVPQYPIKEYDEETMWEAERDLRMSLNADFAQTLTDFAYETASRLFCGEQDNALYSPLSLYYALAMAASGADGETLDQMLEVLGEADAEILAEDCGAMFETFYRDNDDYKFLMAASLWAQQGSGLKDAYLERVRDSYFAEVFCGDFASESMKMAMGDWVKEHTGGLIAPTINPDPQQILSLMNTIYYYVEWTDCFREENTREDVFTKGDKSQVVCDFMNRISYQGFVRGTDYTMASLPTKKGRVDFVLPDEGVDIQKFLTSPEILAGIFASENGMSGYGTVTWKLPKFSYGSNYTLNGMLQSLGIEDAFSSVDADFGKMTDETVWISKVSQMSHVGVNELGIEAAAYTDIAMSGAGMPTDSADMILDRPFLYVIRDDFCGNSPLFIGICQDPTDEQVHEVISDRTRQDPVMLTSAPAIKLQDSLSSRYDPFTVRSGSFEWNYKDGDQMTGMVACGVHPLDQIENEEKLNISQYNHMDDVPYTISCEVNPDTVTVTAWDMTQAGDTDAEPILKRTFEDPYIELQKNRIYVITLNWDQEKLAQRGFYGTASYRVVTEN